MRDKERALAYVRMKANECYTAPTWRTPKEVLELQSCHNWAVDEVLKKIEESDLPPIEVVEKFVKQMDEYSCLNPKTSRMFATAKDAGVWVLDTLIVFGERNSKWTCI